MNNKFRHELKYIISNAQMAEIKSRINTVMSLDSHVMNGIYNIRSLYFDNFDNNCFYQIEDGINDRTKYRLRIYNADSSRITFERKEKHNGKTLKTIRIIKKNENILELKALNMHPVIIVDYDRIPYVYKDGNVRVTFDTNISSCKYINMFYEREIPKRPVMPIGMQLLEVKFDDFIPDIIYKSLEIQNLQQISYSKYYMCRRFTL